MLNLVLALGFLLVATAAPVTKTITGSVFYPSVKYPWSTLSWGCGGDARINCLSGTITYESTAVTGVAPVAVSFTGSININSPTPFSFTDNSGSLGWPLIQFVGGQPDGLAFQSDFIRDGGNYRFTVQGLTWVIQRLTPGMQVVASGFLAIN